MLESLQQFIRAPETERLLRLEFYRNSPVTYKTIHELWGQNYPLKRAVIKRIMSLEGYNAKNEGVVFEIGLTASFPRVIHGSNAISTILDFGDENTIELSFGIINPRPGDLGDIDFLYPHMAFASGLGEIDFFSAMQTFHKVIWKERSDFRKMASKSLCSAHLYSDVMDRLDVLETKCSDIYYIQKMLPILHEIHQLKVSEKL